MTAPGPGNLPPAPAMPGIAPQLPAQYNYELGGQHLYNQSRMLEGDLSAESRDAALQFAQARQAVESQVGGFFRGGGHRTHDQRDALSEARDRLAASVHIDAHNGNIERPGDRLLLGVAALREADRQQVQAAPEAGRFLGWWQRMGTTGPRRFARGALAIGLPLAVVSTIVATGGFGTLPALAGLLKLGIGGATALAAETGMGATAASITGAGVVSALKGALVGFVSGRGRAAIDRRSQNTREVVRERLDGQMRQMVTGMSREITTREHNGQGTNPDQADNMWHRGLNQRVHTANARRDENQAGRARAGRYGAAAGFVFGGLLGAAGAAIHAAGSETVATQGEMAPDAPPTPDQVDAWLHQHQPADWAANADQAAANHDGGQYLYNDVQDGGVQHLSNHETIQRIIPGINEMQDHGAHIKGGGDMHFADGKWTPGNHGKWWFSEVTMPKGGMYAVDPSGKVFYFEGTLDHEHQAVLMDLIRGHAEIFNRQEFVNNIAYHHLPAGFDGAYPHIDGQAPAHHGATGHLPGHVGHSGSVSHEGVVPNATQAGQGMDYAPGPRGNSDYWAELNGGNHAPNATQAGQGMDYVPGSRGNADYWSHINDPRIVPYDGQGQSVTPLQGSADYWAQLNHQVAAGNPYEGNGTGLTSDAAANEYLAQSADMRAAADDIVNRYGLYSQIPVSDTDPSAMVETVFRDSAATIRSFPVGLQDQLVANMAAAAQISQETARQALESALAADLVTA